jgi:hypothetical protein
LPRCTENNCQKITIFERQIFRFDAFIFEANPAIRFKFFASVFFCKKKKELPLVVFFLQQKISPDSKKLYTTIWAKRTLNNKPFKK